LINFYQKLQTVLKTGYTQAQLDGCIRERSHHLEFLSSDNLLYITDPSQTRDYVTDGPKTELLGEASPGFIGQICGLADHKEMDEWKIPKERCHNY
jgi:hypothetical protein